MKGATAGFRNCGRIIWTKISVKRCILKKALLGLSTCVISRGKVSVRLLPNADFLNSDWFMRLWEGQPFSFEKILVMLL